jgi:microcystin-dependent protein
MASGEIDVIPGRVLSEDELIDNAKLNDLGTPTLRIKELAITARELADGSINADKLSVDLEAQLGVPDNSVTTNKLVDGAVTPAKLSEAGRMPTGAILDFAGTTPPDGWLLCYGQAVSRTTYATLFGVISTTWGTGDGVTTFNLPDCRGRVAAGKDDMGGVSAARLSIAKNGNTNSTNKNLTSLGSTANLCVGMSVSGPGIAAGSVIASITSGTAVAMNQNSTATATGVALVFGLGPLGMAGGEQTHILTVSELAAHTHVYSGLGASPGIASGATYAATPLNTDPTGSDSPHLNVQPTIVFNKIIRYA